MEKRKIEITELTTGQLKAVVTGDTFSVKDVLKNNNFKWNPNFKEWEYIFDVTQLKEFNQVMNQIISQVDPKDWKVEFSISQEMWNRLKKEQSK